MASEIRWDKTDTRTSRLQSVKLQLMSYGMMLATVDLQVMFSIFGSNCRQPNLKNGGTEPDLDGTLGTLPVRFVERLCVVDANFVVLLLGMKYFDSLLNGQTHVFDHPMSTWSGECT